MRTLTFLLVGESAATPLWPNVGVKPNTPKVGDLESSGTPECLGNEDYAVGSYERSKSRDSHRNSFGTISGLQFGNPKKKSHLNVVLAEHCREYYMWEGGGIP